MPFTKLPLTQGGGLVASSIPTRLITRHTVRLSLAEPVKIQLSHSSTANVKLAVEYLEPPYPLFEIQCHPQYRAFIMNGVS